MKLSVKNPARTAEKSAEPAKRSRGRPRSEQARVAILRAARALLAEGGPGSVTMEGVAERAGVGKPTVYRWWPDRHAVTMAALMEGAPPAAHASAAAEPGAGADDSATPAGALDALQSQLLTICARFATPTGRHIATMIAAADADSELSKAFRSHFVLARRSEGRALLQQALADGTVRAEVDLEVALDLLYGPLIFRLLMGHAPLDEAFVRALLDHALQGLRA